MPEAVIIGAGISGLSCAWALKKLGIEAVVLEGSSRPGGVIRTERINGYLIEWGPNSFQASPQALEMVEELGLSEELAEPPRHSPRFVYVNGKLRKFPLGPLGLRGVMRVLAEPLVRSKARQDESVAAFFKRRFGKRAHDRLVAPLVTGLYAGDTENLSIAAVFPKMLEMERDHGSLTRAFLSTLTRRRAEGAPPTTPKGRGGIFSFERGMETLPAKMAAEVDVRYEVRDPRIGETRATVLAVPAYRAAGILRKEHPRLADMFETVQYAPMVIAATSVPTDSFKHPLRGFGFLAPRGQGIHLLGALFSSSLFPDRAPEGHVLLTSFVGGAFEPDAVNWSDERIFDIVCLELQRVLGVPAKPQPIAVGRHPYAIPQYNIGHEHWVSRLKVELSAKPGLFLASNYLEGVSVPACMQQGERTAQAVAEYLRRSS